jgi:hypothetical protein
MSSLKYDTISLPRLDTATAFYDLEMANEKDVFLVKCTSKPYIKAYVKKFAEFFRKEFRYDFVQFCPKEIDNYNAFLFPTTDFMSLVGACCFREREYKDTGRKWCLQWIWLHPYYRDKGILKKNWKYFEDMLGDFYVETPYSSSMRGFLQSHDKEFKHHLKH